MVNFKVSDILRIIEDEQLDWRRSCEHVCQNKFLSDEERDNIRKQCTIRVDALDNLKYKFI